MKKVDNIIFFVFLPLVGRKGIHTCVILELLVNDLLRGVNEWFRFHPLRLIMLSTGEEMVGEKNLLKVREKSGNLYFKSRKINTFLDCYVKKLSIHDPVNCTWLAESINKWVERMAFSGKSSAEGISEISGCGNNAYSHVHP